MGIIKKVTDFMEHRKLKKLSDYEIIEKIPEMIEDNPDKVAKALGYVEEQEKVTEILTEIAPNLTPPTVKEIIQKLPEKEKVAAFKGSLAVRDKLTQVKDKEELKGILENVDTYDELYKRINKGINDYELVDFITTFKENEDIGYNSKKISSIISKQMALYIRKYKRPLKGHVQILLNVLKTDEEKRKIPDIVIDESHKIIEELGKSKIDIYHEIESLKLQKKQLNEKETNQKRNKQDVQSLQQIRKKIEILAKELNKIPYYIKNLQEYKKEDLEDTIEQIIEFDKQRAEERGV